MAVAPNGNVYVGNANSANVTEISPLTVTTSPTSPACAQPVTFNISGGDSERDSGGELRGRQPHGHRPLDVIGSGQSTHAYTVGTFTATVNGNPSSVTVSPNPTTLTAQPGTIRLRLIPLPEFYVPTPSATLTTTSGMPVAGQPVAFTAATAHNILLLIPLPG